MRNHTQDDFDGGRAASLITRPEDTPAQARLNTRRQRPEAGPDDDMALALAMLALSEGSES